MKKTISTSGLVLSATPNGEYNKILTVLTGELGIISVYVHGGQSIKNNNFFATNPYSYSEFELYRKNDIYTVKSASIITSFFDNNYSIDSTALLMYCNEVVNYVCCKDTAEHNMLRLALNTFYAIKEKRRHNKQIKGVFDLRCALEQGFAPDFDGCAICGQAIELFDIKEGCGYCKQHGESLDGRVLQVSQSCLNAMTYVLNCPHKKILSFELDEKTADEFFTVCGRYLEYQLEHKFKSSDFYIQFANHEK